MIIKCSYCNKEFNRDKYLIRDNTNFCNKECYYNARRLMKHLFKSTLILVKCKHCGKEILRKRKEVIRYNSHYCSNNCRHIGSRGSRTTRENIKGRGKYLSVCVICGNKHYRSKQINNPTCSIQCSGKWRSENLNGEKASNFKNALKNYICEYCGKEFKSYHKNRQFCSYKCKSLSQKKSLIEVKCKKCGKIHYRYPSYIYWHKQKGNNDFFCSSKCHYGHSIGENNPNYIKDRSLIKNQDKSIRWDFKMKKWRKDVYERDNYTCQICEARSSKSNPVTLNAHHIKKFSKFPKLRTNINNGITLCELCHIKTRGKEEQFEYMFKKMLRKQLAKEKKK